MKITDLKTFTVNVGGSNWVFAKVYTDQGITGLGEGHVATKDEATAAAIMEHKRFLIGKNPFEIERLWQAMYRYPRWRGGPVLNSAISAVELALWDILGKALDVPVYQLLGGACRDRIRLYAHVHGDTPSAAAEHAVELVEAGFTAIKTGPVWVNVDGVVAMPPDIAAEATRIGTIRDAVGDRVDIMIDAHGRTNLPSAAALARSIEEFDIMFLEEATPPEDIDALEWLGARTTIPLATGERLFTKWAFTEIIERHLVNYIQPDIVHAGGILEMKKIAAMAESRFIEVAPHNPQSWVSTMASLHLDACTPNCVIQEYVYPGPALQADIFEGGPVIVDGYAQLPSGPGLGIDLNEAEAAKHPYVPVHRPHWVWQDGSVADW